MKRYTDKELSKQGFAKKSINEYKEYIKSKSKKQTKKRKSKNPVKKVSRFKKKYISYLDSKEWADIKLDIRQNKGNRCEICNSTKKLHVHHKTYKRLFKEEYSDLMLVCEVCHNKIHSIAV